MRVRDLGDLDLLPSDGPPVRLPGRTSTLLGVLLTAQGQVVRAGRLGDVLWPEQDEERQSRSLQTLVWRLRRLLRSAVGDDEIGVVWAASGYRATVPPERLDSHVFTTSARQAAVVRLDDPGAAVRVSSEALQLWRGGYLGTNGDQTWALERRRRLAETHDGLLETRWESLLACGDAQSVVEETAGLGMLRESIRERAWELRMRAQLELGRSTDALQSYRDVRGLLVDGLGLEPGISLRSLQARALASPARRRPDPAPGPPRAAEAAPPRGRRPGPRLVGRAADLAAVTALLGSRDLTLVTVTGPGGVGKTSLARSLVVSGPSAERFPDGTTWVDLAGLRDPALVLPAVSRALGLQDSGTDGGRQLVDFLDGRRLLLVLDNAEHLLDGVDELVALVRSVPDVALLVTSRAALHVSHETVYELRPLAARSDDPTEQDGPAVRLFAERARAADSGFVLTATNRAAVTAVCTRLDGLPLAIELAAARMRIFTPDELLARLTLGLGVLSGGPRDGDERQRTLEGALAWSYRLLGEAEQRLLRGLSVFVGGCTVEAVEAVCLPEVGPESRRGAGVEEGALTRDTLPELLTDLARKSLLRIADARGGRRITLLQTVRDHASAQLGEDERRVLRQRHLDHHLAVVRAAEPELPTAGRAGWLDLLDDERDNLRQASSWAEEHADGEALLALANGLGWFWYFRGPISEGRAWLDLALRHDSQASAPGAARADGLWHAGRLAHLQGDEHTAERLLEESAAIWRRLGPAGERGLAYVLSDLGQVSWFVGQHERGRRLATESVAAFRRCGDRWGLGLALQDLGQAVVSARELDAARLLYEEILAIYVGLDDPWGRGLPLLGLGRVAMESGAHDQARHLLEESLATFEVLGDRRMLAYVLQRMGENEARTGDARSAGRHYRRALGTWQEIGNQFGISLAVSGLAGVATLEGRHAEAALLFGAATSWRTALGRTLSPLDRENLESHLHTARASLGAARVAELEQQGRRLTRDAVLTTARVTR